MKKLTGSSLFLIFGALSAACGSSSSAFTSGNPSGGVGGSGGAAGGSSAGTGNSSAGTGNSSAGTGNGSAGAAGSGAGASGGSVGAGGNSSSSAGGSSAGAGGSASAMCPAATGYYATIVTEGKGCGDYDRNVPVCASAGAQDCDFTVKGDGDKSLDGSLVIKANGTFEGAMVMEGTASRSGCVGMFVPETGVLTIVCGGTDASTDQFCRVKLTRTANVCP